MTGPTSADTVIRALDEIAGAWSLQRSERQRRRTLDPADFDRLRASGYLLTGVPAEAGGLWRGLQASVRDYSQMVGALAKGDPSVALVAAMHPAVLSGWLAIETAPEPYREAWSDQRARAFDSARRGELWGTLTSEPGSGGDIMKTRARAEAHGDGSARLTGDKHFGSGSGISRFMITTARPEHDAAPNVYVMDMQGRAWDGSEGLSLLAEWDGHGMSATQSHAFRLDGMPATAMAWPGAPAAGGPVTAQLGACLFTAVILAVVEQAMAYAREKLLPRRGDMRPFEQMGWTSAVNQAWTMRQVYEGMLTAVEQDQQGLQAASRGKIVAAELAETCLAGLSRVIGGSAFSRSAPFGQWAQDVRALGFLRPPWPLAYDQLFELSWS